MSDEPAVSHPLFARLYSRLVVPSMTRQGVDDIRRRLLAGLKGTVVDVGAGDGANFAHYPDEVRRIVAVEPEPYLREKASSHSDERVELRDAVATRLPVADAEADGCHVARDTVRAIEAAGFTVTELERFTFPEHGHGPASAAVLGRAVPA